MNVPTASGSDDPIIAPLFVNFFLFETNKLAVVF
jgi:hypothetical protein